jgi:tRNA G18 (ribose-2'-O)-methylase SpoU
VRVTSRDARFQQWAALLGNRAKRQRSREFVVQGVRPITLAVRQGWPIRAVLYDAAGAPSQWARQTLDATAAPKIAVAPELMRELGEKDAAAPELLAIAELPADDLSRIPAGPGMLTVVLDRPASPGNLGTVIRSADAFGTSGVIVTGHAADVYDPRTVRASTGSLFSLPVVRIGSPRAVLDWAAAVRGGGTGVRLVGTDENGEPEITGVDLTRPTLLLVGNETAGLAAAWRAACDDVARIPMLGSASSLNAAMAATVALYEAARQRATARG